MENRFISVVVPTYKRPHLLQKCLHALNRQSIDNSLFDVIVVSDGFDELTKKTVIDLAKQLKIKIYYQHTAECKGPAAARNLGWLFAQNPLIAFTDDDCLPTPKWLEEIAQAYHGEEKMVYTGAVVVPTSIQPTDYEKNIARLETAEFITANCACTKNALYAVGGFDERFRMAWREDSDLHFKFLEQHIPIIKLDNATVIHPVRAAKWGISIKEQKKGIYNALLFKKFPKLYRTRINYKASRFYYLLLLLLISSICAGLLEKFQIMSYFLLCWGLLTSWFVYKRLKGTSKSPSHLLEMIFTSLVIPYLSIYWKIYGSVKFRVFSFKW